MRFTLYLLTYFSFLILQLTACVQDEIILEHVIELEFSYLAAQLLDGNELDTVTTLSDRFFVFRASAFIATQHKIQIAHQRRELVEYMCTKTIEL